MHRTNRVARILALVIASTVSDGSPPVTTTAPISISMASEVGGLTPPTAALHANTDWG
jgi:hypothetical protein